MGRAVEDVLAEAIETLRQDGKVDIAKYTEQYPELAGDLEEILPALVAVRESRNVERAALKSSTYARSLFSELRPRTTPAKATVGTIIQSERERSGLSLTEQAHRLGLSVAALKQLSDETTPADDLDNMSIKRIADKIGVPFPPLVKALLSLVNRYRSLGIALSPQAAFTRSGEESSVAEKRALLERVRGHEGLRGGRPSEED